MSAPFRLRCRRIQVTYTERNWVAEGNSNTAPEGGYAHQASTAANPAIDTYTNVASSGANVAELTARAAAVDSLLVSGGTNILSVLIAVNIGSWMTDFAAYLDARRANGWYIILCMPIPADPGTGYEANRQTALTELRQWATSGSTVPGKHADVICDFAAHAAFDGDDAGDTNYFSDGVHLTVLGHTTLLSIFQPVLDASRL